MLCANHSLRAGGHLSSVERALGDRLVAVVDRVRPHVQDVQVAEALERAAKEDVDAVIGMGGGSPIGMAKASSLALEAQRGGRPVGGASPIGQPLVPVIAIPTTYAGSEMTPTYGITHTGGEAARKVTVRDPRIAPKLVIYDPDLTLNLPPEMTASSGINALAHCVEGLYSTTRNPMAAAAAQEGIRLIAHALPRCTSDGLDREARAEMLTGAHLAGVALSMTTMGLHHGLCHVLGGSANVPHGIANSIILPHAMRFNLNAAGPQLALVARLMGFSVDGLSDEAAASAAVEGVYRFIGGLGLPQHLKDAGVAEEDLPKLAQLALQSRTVQENLKPVTDAAQAEAIFRAAW
jgi:alcohol dehydrogenase class IV